MNYYANEEQRTRIIAGLRELADFLTRNPEVPMPWRAEVLVLPPEGSDAEMFAEIDLIAGRIGVAPSAAGSPAGHYSAARDFGQVRYRAVAIPHSARSHSEGTE